MKMEKEQTIDTSEYKYTLLVGEDVYFAQSILDLIIEVSYRKINRWIY